MPVHSMGQATKMVGLHWEVTQPAEDAPAVVAMRLGAKTPHDPSPASFAALADAQEAAHAQNSARLAELLLDRASWRRRAEGACHRAGEWLAGRGIVRLPPAVVTAGEMLGRIERRAAALEEAVRRGPGGVEVVCLPDTLVLPLPLEVGRPVWRLSLEGAAARLDAGRVEARMVSRVPGKLCRYDAVIGYQAFDGAVWFEHNADHVLAEIPGGQPGRRLFLDEAEARRAARALVGEMRRQADALERKLDALDVF